MTNPVTEERQDALDVIADKRQEAVEVIADKRQAAVEVIADKRQEALETIDDARIRWKYRRIMAFSAFGAFALMLFYLTIFASGNNAVQVALSQTLPLALVGIVMAYIGGPIADDWLQLRASRS